MKTTKKILSLLLVLAMVFSLAVPAFADAEAATPATLVSWSGGTSTTNNGEADILSGVELSMKDNGTGLNQYGSLGVGTSTYGNLSVQPWYGTNSFSETNYGYMEFTVATTGYTGLKLETTLGNNGKAPASYAVEVSADGGETWTAATSKLTAPADKVNKIDKAIVSSVDVPAAADDQASVIFRVKQDVAANNANNAGNLYLYTLALTGTAKADPTPDPDPEPGELAGKTVILHTNDIHGQKTYTKADGSTTTKGALDQYASIAAIKAAYEAKGAKVILADAGDFSQGSPYVSLSKGANAVTMMDAAGYGVATLGNHEFDYGIDQLKTNLKDAKFSTVCCNIVDEKGDKIFEGSTVVDVDGVKIGFIGVNTPETQTKANPALIKGVKWLSGADMIAAVNAEAKALEGKADVIVVLSHLGVDGESAPNRSVDLWNGVKDSVDFIIDGHSHTVMDKGPAGESIQSTGTAFANIGVIVIDNAKKEIVSNELVKTVDCAQSDETVAAAAKAITDPIDKEYGAVFAKSEVLLNGEKAYNKETKLYGNRDGETNLGDLITDAMIWQAKKSGGISSEINEKNIVAVTNGGGIRATINVGDITKNDITTVLPFGNTLAVVYITGAELLEALEASTYCSPDSAVGGFPQVSGMKYTIKAYAAYDKNDETYPGSTYYGPNTINRVTIDSVNGQAFDPKATYAVVTNNFCSAGGDTYYAFAAATSQFDTGMPLDEAVMAYITDELKGVVGTQYKDPQGRINYVYEPFSDIQGWFHDYIILAQAAGIVNGFPDGTFRPDDSLTREQYVTMLYRVFNTEDAKEGAKLTFTDADTIGYGKEAVAWAVANGVVNGYTDGSFRPNAKITRAEMAAMTYRALDSVLFGDPDEALLANAGFKDVVKGSYYEEAVNVMANMGIINGMSEGVFAPDGTATRAQAAKILVSILAYFAPDAE